MPPTARTSLLRYAQPKFSTLELENIALQPCPRLACSETRSMSVVNEHPGTLPDSRVAERWSGPSLCGMTAGLALVRSSARVQGSQFGCSQEVSP